VSSGGPLSYVAGTKHEVGATLFAFLAKGGHDAARPRTGARVPNPCRIPNSNPLTYSQAARVGTLTFKPGDFDFCDLTHDPTFFTTHQASLHFSCFDRLFLLPGNSFKDRNFRITRTGNKYQTFPGSTYPASTSMSSAV
jgi:hypothetical protein